MDTCEYQTYIHARLPRVVCPFHGKVTACVPFATPQTSVTQEMECKCIATMQECSVKATAKLTDVTARKLARIRANSVARGLARRAEMPFEKIGIDEKQVFARHKYFSIITDQKGKCVIDVIDGRTKGKVTPWFKDNEAILHDCATVAMDMSAGYAGVVSKYLPNAAICFDKFHVVQIMNRAVDATRKQEQATLDKEQRKKLFGNRFCFLFGKENLPETHRQRFEEACSVAVKTSRAWAIKELLREILNLALPDFTEQFKRWHWWASHSRIKAVVEAARTLKRHFYGICNAVEFGITNALTEGLNSKIETIKRAACGFRNKETFKNVILFHCGKLDLMPRWTN